MHVTALLGQPRHRRGRHWWLASGVFLLWGCGVDDAADADRTVTVSQDMIQVLTSLDIVTRIVDLEPASDGRIWVLNSMAPYFVVVGADGRVERQFGLQGGGPEEFNRPVALIPGVGPGEVWTYDWERSALIRISAEDQRALTLPRDSFPLPSLVSFKGAGINPAPPWIERTDDGFLFARARVTLEESARHLWNADILLVHDGPETRVDPYMPVSDLLGDPTMRYGSATVLIPYPLWAACADGSIVLYDPLSNTLRRFTEERDELRALALPDERRLTMTADLIFEMFYRQFAGDRPSAQVPHKEEMRRLTEEQNEEFVRNSADYFPEYSDLRCAPDGAFWLRRFDATAGRLGHGPDWLRVSADGARTEVLVPPTFTAFRIGRERIWGTLQDSLGGEAIAWMELASLR